MKPNHRVYPVMVHCEKFGTRTANDAAQLKAYVARKGQSPAITVDAHGRCGFFGKNRKSHDCMVRG